MEPNTAPVSHTLSKTGCRTRHFLQTLWHPQVNPASSEQEGESRGRSDADAPDWICPCLCKCSLWTCVCVCVFLEGTFLGVGFLKIPPTSADKCLTGSQFSTLCLFSDVLLNRNLRALDSHGARRPRKITIRLIPP